MKKTAQPATTSAIAEVTDVLDADTWPPVLCADAGSEEEREAGKEDEEEDEDDHRAAMRRNCSTKRVVTTVHRTGVRERASNAAASIAPETS